MWTLCPLLIPDAGSASDWFKGFVEFICMHAGSACCGRQQAALATYRVVLTQYSLSLGPTTCLVFATNYNATGTRLTVHKAPFTHALVGQFHAHFIGFGILPCFVGLPSLVVCMYAACVCFTA